jgi:hypothetical protein
MTIYGTYKYPCLDKYPGGSGFVTDSTIQQIVTQQIKAQGLRGKLSASQSKKAFRKLKASFLVNNVWDTDKYPIIKLAFLDGNQHQKDWVKKVINENMVPLLSKLTFQWDVPIEDAYIRISFSIPKQAWSTVGIDCFQVQSPQPTMNLGWLDDDIQFNGSEPHKNTGQVVLHEFGHAMGMIHEHTNPKNNPIVWNKEVVYTTLLQTNGWDREKVDNNMFEKYGDAELCQVAKEMPNGAERDADITNFCEGRLVNGSAYDVTSIMHYWYPPDWITEGPTDIPINITLSDMDKKWLIKYYGEPEEEEDVSDEEDEDDEEVEEEEEDTVEDVVYIVDDLSNMLMALVHSDDTSDNTKEQLLPIIQGLQIVNEKCGNIVHPKSIPNFNTYIKIGGIILIIVYFIVAYMSFK